MVICSYIEELKKVAKQMIEMKKAVCIIVALILCASLIPSGYADTVSFSDDPKAIQAASNSVVMLSCYDKDGNLFATGSAFAAFEEGAFVTIFMSLKACIPSGPKWNLVWSLKCPRSSPMTPKKI